ncbi:hypothetical protein V8G54_026927 [Vigna mungo]|uniref:Uncharacterized protein n=1 Tax=Vigna mungo TaxID=3915 RepID=A0AAQ3RPY1_VIGMU
MAGRIIPPSAPSTVTRPLVSSEVENYVKPQLNHKQKALQGREVKGCLPKGSRHNSAPSRFVNYKTLGSAGYMKGEMRKSLMMRVAVLNNDVMLNDWFLGFGPSNETPIDSWLCPKKLGDAEVKALGGSKSPQWSKSPTEAAKKRRLG